MGRQGLKNLSSRKNRSMHFRTIAKGMKNSSFPFLSRTLCFMERFYRAIRTLKGLVHWTFVKPVQQCLPVRNADKRILMIYDLSAQPFSIGDILVFQEASLILREENKCAAVDFAFVYDPAHPAAIDPVLSSITEDNCLFHLASILPVAQVNPYLGSLLLFNSHVHLEHYVADNMERYHVWPSAGAYLSREYLYYRIFNELIAGYYRKNHAIPHLQSRPIMSSWAARFLNEHVFPDIPVTVQLRRNLVNPDRNSNYDVWLEFFAKCNRVYPAKFIVICGESEMDDRFKNCPNVVVAKEFRTHVEHDLALIDSAAIHMGAASGPGTMAMFSSRPYLLFASSLDSSLKSLVNTGFIQTGHFTRAFFANSVQQFSVTAETLDVLIDEFQKMWMSLDLESWNKKLRQPLNDTGDLSSYSWLR
ncbi:MAG: hypothetical protein JXL20_03190 [Deltaproteobacteria bacterium]|nr:hypothetical protein [Deltaproteobacteria bacterium]